MINANPDERSEWGEWFLNLRRSILLLVLPFPVRANNRMSGWEIPSGFRQDI